MHRISIPIVLIALCLLFQGFAFSADTDLRMYEPGTKFYLTARWWGLSADGTMEIMDGAETGDENVILVRSQVNELGGLMGVLVKFLRIYKGANTFDSYINLDSRMTKRYEVYRIKDGSKKVTEGILFDRENNRILSLKDNTSIIDNAPPDAQDAFSIFLNILRKINKEELSVGKKFRANLYAYKEVSDIIVKVNNITQVDGKTVYNMKFRKIPQIFKYPITIRCKVTDIGDGFKSVTEGSCTIHIPLLPDITVDAKVRQIWK